jgi:ubiquinone/menaquinone biosynthesis C-methylase UbiE
VVFQKGDVMTLKSRFYDLFRASTYDAELAEITSDARQCAISHLSLQPGETVLDLGCGTGLNQPFLAEALGASGRIIGLDASAKMLEQAQARADRLGYSSQLSLVQGDARRLEAILATDDRPDAILATLIFSVVPDWRNVFQSSFKLLKAGGRYAIMDTYWADAPWRLMLMSWRYAADPKRAAFELLKGVSLDYHFENLPPDTDSFYIASGAKPES